MSLSPKQLNRRFHHKRQSSKKRGIEFKLTYRQYKELLSSPRCHWTGLPIYILPPQPGAAAAGEVMPTLVKSLDRVDETKGYTLENTVVTAHGINQLRNWRENRGQLDRKIKVRCKVIKNCTIWYKSSEPTGDQT